MDFEFSKLALQRCEILFAVAGERFLAKLNMRLEYAFEFTCSCHGQLYDGAAPVLRFAKALYQPLAFESIDHAGQGAFGNQRFLPQFLEGHALGIAQRCDDVELRWGEIEGAHMRTGQLLECVIALGEQADAAQVSFSHREVSQFG